MDIKKNDLLNSIRQMTHNILPCPFCGGEIGEDVFIGHIPPAHYQIKCSWCNITMKHDRRDKVISFWNTRDKNAHKIDL